MKFLFIMLGIGITFNCYAQKKNTYNTTIKSAKTVKVGRGNNVKINKADVVKIDTAFLTVIVNSSVTPKLLMKGVHRSKKLDGNFETMFNFKNSENMPLFNVNIRMTFDKPVLSVDAILDGTSLMVGEGLGNEMTSYAFQAGQITSGYFSIKIISKTAVYISLYGVKD